MQAFLSLVSYQEQLAIDDLGADLLALAGRERVHRLFRPSMPMRSMGGVWYDPPLDSSANYLVARLI
jgi:hypothetical protein